MSKKVFYNHVLEVINKDSLSHYYLYGEQPSFLVDATCPYIDEDTSCKIVATIGGYYGLCKGEVYCKFKDESCLFLDPLQDGIRYEPTDLLVHDCGYTCAAMRIGRCFYTTQLSMELNIPAYAINMNGDIIAKHLGVGHVGVYPLF